MVSGRLISHSNTFPEISLRSCIWPVSRSNTRLLSSPGLMCLQLQTPTLPPSSYCNLSVNIDPGSSINPHCLLSSPLAALRALTLPRLTIGLTCISIHILETLRPAPQISPSRHLHLTLHKAPVDQNNAAQQDHHCHCGCNRSHASSDASHARQPVDAMDSSASRWQFYKRVSPDRSRSRR